MGEEPQLSVPIIAGMHVVVPFAAPLSDAGREALRQLRWPRLSRRLAGLGPAHRDAGDEWTLTPPHERACAAAAGLQPADGLWPLAAALAADDGVSATGPLGLVTPAHWHLGTEQVSLGDPALLALGEEESRRLHAAVAALVASATGRLHYGAASRWYLELPEMAFLPTASLDRVIGRNVDPWLGSAPAMRPVRRLQAEVQMLLHDHPVNGERESRGLLPVNSFWLSGTGAAVQGRPDAQPIVDERLRHAALNDNWSAWTQAWALLDEALAAQPWQQLTLCGERSSLTWRDRGRARWPWPWQRPDLAAVLESL